MYNIVLQYMYSIQDKYSTKKFETNRASIPRERWLARGAMFVPSEEKNDGLIIIIMAHNMCTSHMQTHDNNNNKDDRMFLTYLIRTTNSRSSCLK